MRIIQKNRHFNFLLLSADILFSRVERERAHPPFLRKPLDGLTCSIVLSQLLEFFFFSSKLSNCFIINTLVDIYEFKFSPPPSRSFAAEKKEKLYSVN